MRHFKQFWLVAIATLTSAVAYLLINAEPLYAANGGNAGSGEVGGCSTTGHYCTSWGIVWVKQPLDVFLGSSNIVGLTEQQKNEMRANCAGMIDPYVIRQAYVRFDDGGTTQTDSVAGLIDNDTANRNNAVYVNPATITGGISAATAYGMFQYALSIGVPMTYDWGGTAIFAYDNSWDCPPGDPDCPVPPTPSVTGPYFQSKSKIDVGDGVPAGDNVQESGWDGSTSIEFSTDAPSVEIKFTHTIDYQPNGFAMTTGNGDTFTTKASAGSNTDVADTKNNYTPYTITTTSTASITGDSNAYTTSTGSENHAVATQTVYLNPGETKTVCSVITYSQKHASVKSAEHVTRNASNGPDGIAGTSDDISKLSHNDWYNDGYSGSGRSSACATITRPSDPTGEPKNPNASGATTSNIMFAGETTNLEWGIQASTWDTRRLMERQVTAHLVDAIADNSSRFFTGNSRSGSDPHSYYSGSNIVDRHNFGSEGANLNNSADTYSRVFGVVVPDYVGYKYCHSAGYRYESWYSINGTWKQDTRRGKNYWYVYNASCRTIAKKPTVAIWNSNMMTAGGITTSSSPRFDNPIMGTESSAGGSKTLYGAWVEHLAAIGRNVTYFGSGSSFAIGSKNLAAPKSNPLTLDNSTLTISNNGKLGSSGIFNNSTYRTRLTTFLENQATRPGGSELGAMSNVSDTRILRYDGNLKITGNITTAPGPYNSIYHVPQVVIFVHGDLEIASDVTRIDAWLIVDGKINTCSEFQSGLTEADAISRLRDTCNKQLVFNGPVLANNLVLTRSFGADPLITRTGTFGTASTRQAAGEVFNLRADTYLWAYAQAGRYDSSYTESYTRELAPRY